MVRVIVPGVPSEIMVREREAAASEKWPFSLWMITCPDCGSLITVERNGIEMDVSTCDTEGYDETVDASVRCRNCWDELGWNIDLSRRRRWVRRGWRFSREWVTTITSKR